MAKYYGAIGYAKQVRTKPGVSQEKITERFYSGDVLQNIGQTRDGENLNPDDLLQNRFSIVGDPFAYENLGSIRYLTWMGTKWQVNRVEVVRPRLILSVGRVYNEQTRAATKNP